MALDNLETKIRDILPEMWQEVCEKGSSVRFRISSGSMSPMINVGDIVKVRKIEPSAVCAGDVVAFQTGQRVIVHRVIARKWSVNGLIFRHGGDSSVSSGVFKADMLIGKVVSINKAGRDIPLDTVRHVICGRIMVLRLRLKERIERSHTGFLNSALLKTPKLLWRLLRNLILWRL